MVNYVRPTMVLFQILSMIQFHPQTASLIHKGKLETECTLYHGPMNHQTVRALTSMRQIFGEAFFYDFSHVGFGSLFSIVNIFAYKPFLSN